GLQSWQRSRNYKANPEFIYFNRDGSEKLAASSYDNLGKIAVFDNARGRRNERSIMSRTT
ncbi:hypothetical protein M1N23_03800, partial [Dehalococcoidia bacterium]|nr:hypothetical protein [Dehalococcoidia bacterium]